MGNRSNINLVGNTTTGQNLGSGDACVFKCKTGNNFQFRSISATGSSVQVIQTDDEILIFAEGGGSSGTTYTFTNGLTKTLQAVCLGGTLTMNTTIASGGYCLNLTGLPAKTSETNVLYIDSAGKISSGATATGGGTITGATNGLSVSGKNIALGGVLNAATTVCGAAYALNLGTTASLLGAVSICGASMLVCTTGAISLDGSCICAKALTNYDVDYSGSFVARSIPDVAWVTGNTGGGFLGTITRTSSEPTNLKNNQWLKPKPDGNCYCYTFTNFLDSGSTAISVNLSLEDVYLRYHQTGDYWSKESYNKPLTSGHTWIGHESSNCVCEVPVINEWVSAVADLDYTGQKFAYDTQSLFQVDVGTCITIPHYILIQNINLKTVGNTVAFTIPTGKAALINRAKLIMLNDAAPTSFSVSLGNNSCATAALSYNNLVSTSPIDDVLTRETYELTPLQQAVCNNGACCGSTIYFRVQSGSTSGNNLCAHLLIEGFVY